MSWRAPRAGRLSVMRASAISDATGTAPRGGGATSPGGRRDAGRAASAASAHTVTWGALLQKA